MSVVNSLHPPATPGVETRPNEPSMEEILASIRRIIADDQSMPTAPREPEPVAVAPAGEHATGLRGSVAPSAIAEPPSAPAPVHVLHPEPHRPTEPSRPREAPTPPAAPVEIAVGHGDITPQFVSPEGPAGTPHVQHAPAPEVAGHGSVDEGYAALDDVDDPADRGDLYDDPLGGHAPEEDVAAPEPEDHQASHEMHRVAAAAPDPLFSASTDQSVTAAFNALAATRLAANSDELLAIARDMIRPLLREWIDDNLPSMVERMVRAEIERVARGGR